MKSIWDDPRWDGILTFADRVYYTRADKAFRAIALGEWERAFFWANLAGRNASRAVAVLQKIKEDSGEGGFLPDW